MSVGVMGAESMVGRVIAALPAARGKFDLHPFWAVLAFRASIDGLLCLSDPLAMTRHPRPQVHIAGPPQAAVRAHHEHRHPLVETAFGWCGVDPFDRCTSRLVVSVIVLRR